ncbi:DNA sulfur modification protein DndB [Phytohabitans sp. LJ34]|uniref:DNA sulfur modification protein DndB n=1 Tax=Phytohabitans sp. LJ34 TaxID=3452217 RepID=UPI003F8B4E73
MTFGVLEGVPIRLMPFRQYAAVGVMTWGTLLTLVPDPVREENATALRSDRKLREHAELRSEVQRLLKGTAKGKNVKPYAAYIAAGLRGELDKAWSSPPICLWSSRPLEPGPDGVASLPLGVPIVAIDGETQVAAMHAIMNDPAAFDLDEATIGRTPVAFEIYWDITTSDARQIFHDRNLFGVSVAKTLALSMDQRDFGTTIAQRVLSITEVSVGGKSESFSHFVNSRKRQLGQSDPEWMTLSGLRSLCVTVLFGKPGIEATSGTIEKSDLADIEPQIALNEVSSTVSSLVRAFSDDLATRSALTAPAILAGVGAAAHRTTSWTREQPRLTSDQLHSLLRQVRWEREEKYWEGVAAKRTASGGLSFAGGAKDSGHRVCDAVLNPDSDLGKRIRGR